VHHRAPALIGAVLGAVTAAVYLIGSNRSFGYDAAASFANFIATKSLWDAFAVHTVMPSVPLKSVASNDHVLLSLVSHLIYSATGSRSEVVYRLAPALAAGGTVGVATTVLVQRFGTLAGVCAGVFIATDPLFVDNSRDLRGYSLAALGAVLATLILAGKWTRWRLVAYALLMGLAIAAQLFAVVVLLIHVAWIATRRSWPPLIQLAPSWIAAAAIGAIANANIQYMELVQHGYPPSVFYPAFPRDLVFFLLGAPVLVPLGLWLSTAALGMWTQRKQAWLWAVVGVMAVVVAALWLGLRPAFLYPRFFIFLVPACAFLIAAAIARWKVLAPVVVVGAVVAAISQVSGYTADPLALPQAAAVVERVHAGGGHPCVIHIDEQVLAAYTTDFAVVSSPDQLASCDTVVVVSWNVDLTLRDLAAQEFPRATALQANYPAVVLEK
jgi:4-amino-4-deoxy-L-arabinose transferase-like glycosyltransferase